MIYRGALFYALGRQAEGFRKIWAITGNSIKVIEFRTELVLNY